MDEKSKKPVKYFFVGVGKSGTSWIYAFLKRNGILSLPSIKEPYLIDLDSKAMEAMIGKVYTNRNNMADLSTTYYWDHANAKKIYEYNPEAKILITVRRPSERIQSHFAFLQRSGLYTNLSLPEYLLAGDKEDIVERSNYFEMIKRYTAIFGESNVLIMPLEQLKLEPILYIESLCEFVGVEPVSPTDEDVKPVLVRSEARVKILAYFAKKMTNLLRSLGFLGLLGKLKSSKFLYNILYRNSKKSDVVDFGIQDDYINKLDEEYKKRIGY